MYFESLIFVLTNSNSIILLCVLRHFFYSLLSTMTIFSLNFPTSSLMLNITMGFSSQKLFLALFLNLPLAPMFVQVGAYSTGAQHFKTTSVPWGAGRLCHMFLPNPASPSLLFILPSFTPFLTAFLSLHRFKFLTCIIFLLSKKPLLTFRVKCVY